MVDLAAGREPLVEMPGAEQLAGRKPRAWVLHTEQFAETAVLVEVPEAEHQLVMEQTAATEPLVEMFLIEQAAKKIQVAALGKPAVEPKDFHLVIELAAATESLVAVPEIELVGILQTVVAQL